MRILCGTILSAAVSAASFGKAEELARTIHELGSFPVACIGVAAVEGHEPSLLPKGVKLGLVWHDEFDGDSLDESKWSYRTNFWGRRAHWYRNDRMTGKGVPELEDTATAGDGFLVDFVRVYDIAE